MRRLVLWAALVLGCDDGAGDDDGGGVGSGESGALAPCDEQPVLTYDTFGRGFLATYCDGCHGGDVTERQGAPPSVVLDTRQQVLALADRILARTAPDDGSAPTMPPVGGVTPDDRDRLVVWLRCWQ